MLSSYIWGVLCVLLQRPRRKYYVLSSILDIFRPKFGGWGLVTLFRGTENEECAKRALDNHTPGTRGKKYEIRDQDFRWFGIFH